MKRLFLCCVLLLLGGIGAFASNSISYTNTSTTAVHYNESANTGNNGPFDWWADVVVTIQAGSGFTGTRSAPVYINGRQIGTISSSVSLTATLNRTFTTDPNNGYYGSSAVQNNGNVFMAVSFPWYREGMKETATTPIVAQRRLQITVLSTTLIRERKTSP
jgi:hypothetical protein